MKKWVNVKDSWLRYYKKANGCKNNVPGKKFSRKYLYTDALQFLKKNYSFFDDREPSMTDSKHLQETETSKLTLKECRTFAEPLKILNTETKKKKKKRDAERLKLSEDRHLSFFRGIMPSLIHLTEDEVLQFQVGVMSVLKGIKDAKKNPTLRYHPQHSAMPSLMWNTLTPFHPNILGYQGNYIPQYQDALSTSTSKDSSAAHHSSHPLSASASATQVATTSYSGLDEDQIDLESTESSFLEESISSDSYSTTLIKQEKSD